VNSRTVKISAFISSCTSTATGEMVGLVIWWKLMYYSKSLPSIYGSPLGGKLMVIQGRYDGW
jgi:hypothetical protein